MKKPKTPWIRHAPSPDETRPIITCERCGESHVICLPMYPETFSAHVRSFCKLHVDCVEPNFTPRECYDTDADCAHVILPRAGLFVGQCMHCGALARAPTALDHLTETYAGNLRSIFLLAHLHCPSK